MNRNTSISVEKCRNSGSRLAEMCNTIVKTLLVTWFDAARQPAAVTFYGRDKQVLLSELCSLWASADSLVNMLKGTG